MPYPAREDSLFRGQMLNSKKESKNIHKSLLTERVGKHKIDNTMCVGVRIGCSHDFLIFFLFF